MRWLALAGFVLAMVALSGAPAGARTVAGDSGGITGTVTQVGGSEVLVEANPDESHGSDKAFVRVTPDTRIGKQSGAGAGFGDLTVGSRVEVRFAGPVAESYPLQAAAASIAILDGKDDGVLPATGGARPALPVLGLLALVLAFTFFCGCRAGGGGRSGSGAQVL